MPEQVVVPFEGKGQGLGELTWAQKGLWKAMLLTGSSLPVGGISPLPPDWTTGDLALLLRFLLGRHPSLRTRMALDPAGGLPRQHLASAGEVVLQVLDAGAEDPAAVAGAQLDRWQRSVFDYEAEWPIRTALVTADGAATHLVAVYCHLALDLHGLEVLLADLATMDRRTGRSNAPVLGTPPLELAAEQRRPRALRRSAAALAHWESTLRRIPARRLPGSADRREPRFWELGYSSVAALRAARIIAARSGLRTAPVLLAACAVALRTVTGQDPSVLQVLVSNRFRPGLARAVTPLTQSSLCVVDVGAADFDEIAAGAQRAVVRAGKNAYYDPVLLDEIYRAVDVERGEDVDVDCFFNDRRRRAGHDEPGPVPSADEVRAALPHSALRLDRTLEHFDHRLFVHVNDVPESVDWTVCADTHHLSPADAEALLVRMEAALVAAALSPS